MIKKEAIRHRLETAFAKYKALSEELRQLAGRIFCKRKVIVISEKGISSIPISSKSQGAVVLVAMLILLWISYSTGKYVTYENVISEKDREIWNTNVTNEGLQYQMADLHQNLADLNKYFENIKQLDINSQKSIANGKPTPEEEVARVADNSKVKGNKEAANSNVQEILSNIREKVISRIGNLENILQMTGLNLKKVADNNVPLRNAMINTQHLHSDAQPSDPKHQGGPLVKDDSTGLFNQDEFESEINYLMQLEKVVNSMPIAAPLKQYNITSGFGRRMDPINGEGAVHTGMDISDTYKAKVYSSAPGVVSFADMSGAYGRLIEIDHGSGITTLYGHLDRILVREGETVKRGQLIGLQGNSGRSTGSHLHYEVRLNNQPINPANFLEAGKYVF